MRGKARPIQSRAFTALIHGISFWYCGSRIINTALRIVLWYKKSPFKGLLHQRRGRYYARGFREICFVSDRGLWLYDPAEHDKGFQLGYSSVHGLHQALEQDKEGNVFSVRGTEPLSWTKRIRFSASVRGSTSREFQLRIW